MNDLELARHLGELADQLALEWFHRGFRTTWKGDGSPVTEADLAVDAAIREELALHRPDDAVLTEEHGLTGDAGGDRRWLIDPIDGTSWFADRLQHWGTHIALEERGTVTVGVITRPMFGLSWYAASGQGAFRSDSSTPLRLTSTSKLAAATITGYVWQGSPLARAIDRIARWRSASAPMLALLDGEVDAVISDGGYEWDHAPALVLVAEAGGRFTDPYGGSRFDLRGGLYSNGHLHDELAALLYD